MRHAGDTDKHPTSHLLCHRFGRATIALLHLAERPIAVSVSAIAPCLPCPCQAESYNYTPEGTEDELKALDLNAVIYIKSHTSIDEFVLNVDGSHLDAQSFRFPRRHLSSRRIVRNLLTQPRSKRVVSSNRRSTSTLRLCPSDGGAMDREGPEAQVRREGRGRDVETIEGDKRRRRLTSSLGGQAATSGV